MNRAEKAAAVEQLRADLAKSRNAILFGFAGLKVPEVTELRRQVRSTQSKYLVVKNTLALRAAQGTAFESVARCFVGPTAVAYNENDAVALAKTLTNFAKSNPNLVFKGAVIDGKPVEAGEIQAIAELPTREELVGRLLALLQSPVFRLIRVLASFPGDLAKVLRQVADQKSKSGPAEAAPTP